MKYRKIAIVHDWLTGMRGGEKCLEVFCELYPEATLFTLLHDKGSVSPVIEGMDIRTSFLQNVPGISRHYRNFLPFFPRAIEGFDLSGYDLVLSSSHCVAKGVKKAEGSLHICYCYTPVRYVWKFFDEYFKEENPLKRWFIARTLKGLKKWDHRTNERVDHFIAISDNVRQRINNFYSREADVIYPPVDISAGDDQEDTSGDRAGYYLIVSALVPYKRIDLAVKAFNQSGRSLTVIGSGSELSKLKKYSSGNISFRGWVDGHELKDHYRDCKALIFPGEEDFGIVPVEAQAYGKPVIAYARGGALETVVPFREGAGGSSPTGVFFHEQTAESLNDAIDRYENNRQAFVPEKLRDHVRGFSRERFKKEIHDYVEEKWRIHEDQK